MRKANEATKERFLLAAIRELQENGVSDFSVRRVAQSCGVSCGAPYKHFDGKNGLILGVIRYINQKWNEVQLQTLNACTEDVRQRLVEISVAYVRFLCRNPEYQTILMLNDRSMQPEQLAEKGRMSVLSTELVDEYCRVVHMSDTDRVRKLFAVRSFIYGAAVMMNAGELPRDEVTVSMVRYCIEREFELA